MEHLKVDWLTVFRPDLPLLETVVRGTVIYLVLLILFRVGLRRTTGQLTTLDFVFVLLAGQRWI